FSPVQTERDAASSASIDQMICAPIAASRGDFATVAPSPVSTSALAGFRFHTLTAKPCESSRLTIPVPIMPRPRNAIEVLVMVLSINREINWEDLIFEDPNKEKQGRNNDEDLKNRFHFTMQLLHLQSMQFLRA